MADDGWMTAVEIANKVGATEYSVNRAILALGLYDTRKSDLSDRRRTIYPPGTLQKVKDWLDKH